MTSNPRVKQFGSNPDRGRSDFESNTILLGIGQSARTFTREQDHIAIFANNRTHWNGLKVRGFLGERPSYANRFQYSRCLNRPATGVNFGFIESS